MAADEQKTALVLAGGGIMGAVYEIGCLTALDRLFAPPFSCSRFDIYVGVSAGSIIAALAASRIAPGAMFRAIANDEPSVFNFRRRDIYRLDAREIFSSCWRLSGNLWRIWKNYRRFNWPFAFGDLGHILQEQFPAGLFSLEPLQNYLCRSFRSEGVLDDFRLLDPELYIPAYDLDLGRRAIFGEPGLDDMHICQAITASCAIPYFFRPQKIAGRHYLDGSTGRVAHIDIAIEKGAKLIVVLNPRVPMENDLRNVCLPSLSYGRCSSISHLGLTFALEQARRIENKEKLDLALENYRKSHPDIDILLIEPNREESLLFFQSPMSSEARHHVMNHGYNLTLGQLRSQFGHYRDTFARYGIELCEERLGAAPPAAADT